MRVARVLRLALATVVVVTLALVGCSKPVSTLTTSATVKSSTFSTSTTPVSTTRPSSPASSVATATSSPTSVAPGPYGALAIAGATIGNERLYLPDADPPSRAINLAAFVDFLLWIDGATVKPGIAESWEMSPDGLSWIFRIRKGVKFHNGDDLTAADVKFSMDLDLQKTSRAPLIRDMVGSTEQVNDYTVRVHSKGPQPFLPFLFTLSSPSSGMVLPKGYVEQRGVQYFEQHPIGSGSFRLVNHLPGDMFEYEAMNQHWRQTPSFKKLTVVLMPEESTRVASLKTGQADIIEASTETGTTLSKAGFQTAKYNVATPTIQFHGTFLPEAAGMPASDVRVRQAISLAIDRAVIMKEFFQGLADPPMPPYLWQNVWDIDVSYWKNYSANAYRHDPEAAKRLLKEAGYPNGFSMNFYTFPASGASFLPSLGVIIQNQLAQIGIKAQIVPIDNATYTSWRLGPAPQLVGQMVLYRMQGETFTARVLASGFSWTGGNNRLLKDPDLDKLINTIFNEMDGNKRTATTANVIKKVMDSWVAVQLAVVPVLGVIRSDVSISALPSYLANSSFPMYASAIKHK